MGVALVIIHFFHGDFPMEINHPPRSSWGSHFRKAPNIGLIHRHRAPETRQLLIGFW